MYEEACLNVQVQTHKHTLTHFFHMSPIIITIKPSTEDWSSMHTEANRVRKIPVDELRIKN